ncbi:MULTISPECIES: pyrimidine 5'-nucleotidase [unclassified Undibacterium]|uniref:pyrimidine 5'-nucleotidase n=1 Tax=unclassified Undibacterium TaxID=2630295 RepID=UPI002AC924AC|nr:MULTISPECIES: pyrimidine 5'-nucleotidase [unclassified Undibacterium]MEB0139953.1 pyrimidine 5'-nucleotidase [Undibacterium sp. CCC2.1]MEB0172926.1 pyrimidine 5'-nucleotidase [Undibacterium sp. CCC1.1]MEB0176753.1 pyrimidine 5'-nucleotidase [Undibacterium sp. CCC3.4]MEB0216680.1 pyrimidine 5'-nucleotidase [Undibacterium sp. 5I2]WPX44992.1 pyrimidine 5'-nucleotidase [Undibacterium sp. CCC3.4]
MAGQPIWLFDLDNTLHDASHAIFPAINRNMNAYIAALLGVGEAAADQAAVNALRLDYYRRYGVTMLGLVRHHAVKAEEFLHAAHTFDDLLAMIRARRGLRQILQRLPGKKILLTNAPRLYSRRVLRHLNLQRHFDDHISVEDMRVHGQLEPKPSRRFLRKLLAARGYAAADCILVEDSLDNLRAAKREGLQTVWLTGFITDHTARQRAACVDIQVRSVLELAQRYRRRPA